MNADRWQTIEKIFHDARELTGNDRVRFLDRACPDTAMRQQLDVLLQHDGTQDTFLTSPAVEMLSTLPLSAGMFLASYEIRELIGVGGVGEVYKARDTRLGRHVAIKVLRPDKTSDPNWKRRFMQEAKAASALNHPNIVTIYDIGSENGIEFIVMEYVSGRSLDRVIPRHGMKVSDALDHAILIADGLAKAHAAGIVHRDLKPGNILVGDDGALKLVDFGLAKSVENVSGNVPTLDESLTEDGAILGTVAYMSPEQAEAKRVDARSDIFSFGTVLYEMLTGRKAFLSDSRIGTLSAILHEEPDLADLPQGLGHVIARCLRKDPAKRWQSMADLVTMLQDSRVAHGAAEPTRVHLSRRTVFFAVVVMLFMGSVATWLLRPKETSPYAQLLRAVPFTSYPGSEFAPSFSPDGSQVAFTWNGEAQDNVDIYVKSIGPRRPLPLTDNPANDVNPRWSPDGNLIAFLRFAGPGRQKVILIPPIGGTERPLMEVPRLEPGFALAWSPDSKSLVIFDRPSSEPAG